MSKIRISDFIIRKIKAGDYIVRNNSDWKEVLVGKEKPHHFILRDDNGKAIVLRMDNTHPPFTRVEGFGFFETLRLLHWYDKAVKRHIKDQLMIDMAEFL